jgi:hypothetical protein
MKTVPPLFLLLIAGGVSCATGAHIPASVPLRTDGIYWSSPADTSHGGDALVISRRYLHFYAEGTVLHVSSTGAPSDLRRWFFRGRRGLAVGRYVVERQQIQFSVFLENGQIDFAGTAKRDSLRLRVDSQINGYRGTETYYFVPWETRRANQSLHRALRAGKLYRSASNPVQAKKGGESRHE